MRVAQLDRASDYGSEGRGFESFHARIIRPEIILRLIYIKRSQGRLNIWLPKHPVSLVDNDMDEEVQKESQIFGYQKGCIKIMDRKIIDQITDIVGADYIKEGEPLCNHSTIKIGGMAKIFAEVTDEDKLLKLLTYLRQNNIAHMVIGNASNLLFDDEGYDGVIICTDVKDEKISEVLFFDTKSTSQEELDSLRINADINILRQEYDQIMIVGCGARLSSMVNAAKQRALGNLEFASGIPGTVGGAVAMNAGAYGNEIKDFIIGAFVIDKANNYLYKNTDELNLSYRNSAVQKEGLVCAKAVFGLNLKPEEEINNKIKELNQKRRDKQPLDYPSCGSAFKRPEGAFAAQLIDEAGLKGFKVGDMQISEKHAGFMINIGNGNSKDAKELLKQVQEKVYENCGINLEPEIKIIDTH